MHMWSEDKTYLTGTWNKEKGAVLQWTSCLTDLLCSTQEYVWLVVHIT